MSRQQTLGGYEDPEDRRVNDLLDRLEATVSQQHISLIENI